MRREDHIVKRANETIGIVPQGKQRITHLVRRLYSVILLFSQQQGEQEEYVAYLSDMLAAANSSGSNRTQVKAILREIRAIGVDWNVRDGDRDVWKNVGLIEEPGLIDGKGTPTIVTWKLPKLIRTRLLDPRGFFTKISLEMMTRLRSGASIALYEICCQYVSNDHGKGEGGLTNRATIADWMPRLTGSRKADYEYKFLKRDVVLTAIEEINDITDLRVELIEHKVGRKVGELQFRVFRKDILPAAPRQLVQAPAQQPDVHPDDLQRVLAIGATQPVAERICRKYVADRTYLHLHLDYVEARIRSTASAPLINKTAFLQKALDHGYADGGVVPTTSARSQIVVGSSAAVSPQEVAEKQRLAEHRAAVWDRFQALDDQSGKSTLVEAFLQQTSATTKTFYKKNGLNNMIVKASLTDWLMQEKGF